MSGFESDRRQLLHFLLTSPVLAGLGVPLAASGPDVDEVITTARQALNVMDFEAAARRALLPAHFGYLATGVDDEATVRANREGFSHFSLRVRRLVNVREIDMSVSLFGSSWDSPIVLAPVSSQRAFHADGEIASAKAARTRNHLQVLSTLSSTDVEAVGAARGAPVWYQLYATDQWRVTEALVRRAEAAGCSALVLTVDLQGGSNRETLERARRRDTRDCAACHEGDPLQGRMPVLIDGGFRRGTDIFKALALGATAVCVGRPYVSGTRGLRPGRGGSGTRRASAGAGHGDAPGRQAANRRHRPVLRHRRPARVGALSRFETIVARA